MKYGQKWWFRERGKMCCFPLEIQQFWHINKINELVNAAKFEYFFGNMKDCENQSTTIEKGNAQNAYNYGRFWRKSDVEAPRKKNRHSKNAYIYCRFWWILMITSVEERWRTFSFWVWRGLQQHFEAHAMKDENDAVRKVDFPGGTQQDSEKW